MMAAAGTCMIFVTCPYAKVAEAIAKDLVDQHLAACGSVTPSVTSVYRWKGKVMREREVLLLLKTRRSLVPACTTVILARHPYELPEIIAVPIVGGLPPYLQWVARETRGGRAR